MVTLTLSWCNDALLASSNEFSLVVNWDYDVLSCQDQVAVLLDAGREKKRDLLHIAQVVLCSVV